ncbi:MAG: hypothetical protein A4E63_00079 [Syntrophorhabdus sp. PtaU1.Bin050]|nr:MAG: hypothetical protein A4E63_00079 [Syntrophorhabdus sp. PtaU1.Bin050]
MLHATLTSNGFTMMKNKYTIHVCPRSEKQILARIVAISSVRRRSCVEGGSANRGDPRGGWWVSRKHKCNRNER